MGADTRTEPGDGDEVGDRRHPILDRLSGLDGGSTATRFLGSFLLSFRAARLLATSPKLWPYVVVPALVNVVLFVGFLALFWLHLGTVVGWVWSPPPVEAWYDWVLLVLRYLLVALVAVLSLGLSYVLALLVGGLVAAPFRDALSVRTERILLGVEEVPGREESLLAGTLRGLASDLLVLGSYCVVMVPVLLLNLVPAVGSVAASILGTVVSAFFLAFEFSNDALDRRERDLRGKVELLRDRRLTAFGFGFGTSLLLWIPFVNFLTIPIAVVGGTALGIAMDEWDREADGVDTPTADDP